ncbi:hypothetical protein FB451DRAFT_1401571 [Mycena latifolia]|nr:hypothetical protein FB451DRAFT_1401571 [Mycena latifolia]
MLHTLYLDTCLDRIVIDAFETAPRLRSLELFGLWPVANPTVLLPWNQITRYICDFGKWDDHIAALEQLLNVEECRLTLTNWAPHTGVLELVIEPLDVTPFPDVFGNLSSLIVRSACQLTKLCLIAAIPPTQPTDNRLRLAHVLRLLPSLIELCVQSRRPNETIRLGLDHRDGIPDEAALVNMVDARRHANPAVCSILRAFSLQHFRRLSHMHPPELDRLEMLRPTELDLTVIVGPGAREAMVNVPLYYAGLSDGEFWAPDTKLASTCGKFWGAAPLFLSTRITI